MANRVKHTVDPQLVIPTFTERDDCKQLYTMNYPALIGDFTEYYTGGKKEVARELLRTVIKQDLFFIVYFIIGWYDANHPFIVQACRELQNEDRLEYKIYLWARGHGKSTIITTCGTIQDVLNDPEIRIILLSYKATLAKDFLRRIRSVLESNALLQFAFPDILYTNASKESYRWSDDMIVVKRHGKYTEGTIEAGGLIDGMPTGKHFSAGIYDDVVTADHTTEQLREKTQYAFNLSLNLINEDRGAKKHRVIGTRYHAGDLYGYLLSKEINGFPLYKPVIKSATDDGTALGKPVFISQKVLDELKTDEMAFSSQMLLDPRVTSSKPFKSEDLQLISFSQIPPQLYKIMLIDPAGQSSMRTADSWAIFVVGVLPPKTKSENNKYYILDAYIAPAKLDDVLSKIVNMYLTNGIIQHIGIERSAGGYADKMIQNELLRYSRTVVEVDGSLVILKPRNIKKEVRIRSALSYLLSEKLFFISDKVEVTYYHRLKDELNDFPYAKHDDGIDALSYIVDVLHNYKYKLERWGEGMYNVLRSDTLEDHASVLGWT